MSLSVKFWGVRGSIACPSPRHVGFGGNTSCLEVVAGDTHIILDAGTGIRALGQEILSRDI
ncbi:MAG TPA: MBL fold metallo-hydrolase, partial [Polyangiaceae bacterium]|nr:MBL fold metallo-hydrolase [Polyangiaceae bacterium]